MPARILHVLDETTPPDAMEILARVVSETPHDQKIVALGHRSTGDIAVAAGITRDRHPIAFMHSMGWADPTGWRSLRKAVKGFDPTHVHAWGVPAAFATVMTRFAGQRLVTLVDLPRAWHLQLLTFIHKGGLMVSASACRWIVTSSWLKRELHGLTIGADAVILLRHAIHAPPHPPHEPATPPDVIREDLGIPPGDGPVVLLGGDGGIGASGAMLARPGIDPMPHGGRGGARHDIGLWSTTILRQIFPRIRAVVREDPRQLPDHGLERLMDNLPEDDIVVIAPARYSWPKLLSIADLLLVTPDGPFAAGSILHALAARVPVIGTPVDAVREHVVNLQNGMLAASNRPREIAAAIESFLSQPALRERFAAAVPHGNGSMGAALDMIYAGTPVSAWQTA